MGKNLSILAGFTTAKFSEKQKSFISKISSDYFFIEAIITLFFLWTFINDQYLMLGIVLLMVPLFMFIIHINLKLRQTK
ncbi:hypothetical protein FC83_GL003265 [Agrilactobacillus composti DSM 18527 = JCM 14202]|uniref:Uncharacterized protein n=2 Tax=Agrilactobacillus TaxID=2767875 RepID=X0PNE5_9LACO|nr:hypothetical protein FC83_GL003265 [Agrilactobacillus composti DSM 18527 = JCM 14202]GAF38441.1 hypothetical protein JCM14202_251 [Agrilactobacillus composti DSM 18527 = JCM 14202]